MNNIREKLNEILINKKVRENETFIMTIIPELINSVFFKQNHPHHHLDVWNHTLLALDKLESNDLETNMALLLHDIGKPFSYQDEEVRHFHGHAKKSKELSKNILERLGYNKCFIDNVLYLIEHHDELIDPKNTNSLSNKLLDIQYADAKAHHPDKILQRIRKLDEIKKNIE